MMDFRNIVVIINPAAGLEEPSLKTLNSIFRGGGAHWDVSITNEAGDGRRLAQAAVAAGADLVIASGGDGSLAEVASGMIGSEVPMAFLPGGTGNVMAAELGIPRDLARAAMLLFHPTSRLRTLDLGQIGERMFMMRVGAGFEAAIIQHTTREMKERFGLLAYGVGLLETLTLPLTARYTLTLDGQTVETEGFSLLIANAGSIGRLNLTLSPTIRPDDGLLDVMILRRDPESMLSIAASVIQLDGFAAGLEHWQVREVTVAADPPQDVQLDGDLFETQTPVTVRVIPGAVRIVVPDR